VSPRPSPDVNHALKQIVNMFYRLVSQVCISCRLMSFVRLGSLSVEGQEPVIYLYVCRSINKI
jgi:hypothetical protein